jgi:hypothetical protein
MWVRYIELNSSISRIMEWGRFQSELGFDVFKHHAAKRAPRELKREVILEKVLKMR